MSREDDNWIEDAAVASDAPAEKPQGSTDQPENSVGNVDLVEQAEEDRGSSAGEKREGDVSEENAPDAKLLERYHWFKCKNPSQGPGIPTHYFTNTKTGESSWTEPSEPYWLYNTDLSGPDPAGLQFPPNHEQSETAQTTVEAHPLRYNPKIHGDYDPNADYAKYTEQHLAEKSGTATHNTMTGGGNPAGMADYSATMALNGRTGSAQPTHLTADRHNDFAKSGRQMNAFFDVDAAANAHDGKSLKEERKNKKLTKAEVKAFNEARKERKQKKRLAFYKS